MIFIFMYIIKPVIIIVQPLIIYTTLKGEQEVIFLNKLHVCARYFCITLKACPDIIFEEIYKWIYHSVSK